MYVADILVNSGTNEYLPMFARKKITREEIREITDQKLKEVRATFLPGSIGHRTHLVNNELSKKA